MAESWVRLWSGMTLNAKWQTIARKSGQRRSLVIAMFTHLLMIANESEPRGSVAGADIEDIASALDEDEEAVQAIWDALLGRAIDPETLRLTGWEKHQPAREDHGNPETGAKSPAERKRDQRAREKAVTEYQVSRDVTQCHAVSRTVTRCHAPEAEADTESDTEKAVLKRASTDLTVVAPDPSEQLALSAPPVESISEAPPAPTTRQGAICQQLRDGGMSDAAPSYLDPDTWERILALRTDGEIVELALAKMRDRPGKRTGLKYVAPILLDPPQRIAGPPAGARASPVAKSDALRAHNRAAFAEAKAAIFAREQKHAVE